MELTQLRYFVAVAEELHFGRAAERLHVTQPAVSVQVRKLELELGVRLLDRTHHSVSLTGAGAVLLNAARGVLHQVHMAKLAARNAHETATGRLRIGYMPTALMGSILRILRRLAAATPLLETSMESGTGLKLIEAVRSERLDAAIVSLPAPTNGLRTTTFDDQRAVAALPVGHHQAVKPEIHLEQMAPERIVVLPRDADRPFHDAIVATYRDAGLTPTLIEMPDAHVEQALLAVASGAGMALLPESVAERYSTPGVRFVPVGGDQAAITTAIVTRRDSEHMPTVAFLRAITHANRHRVPPDGQYVLRREPSASPRSGAR